MTSNEAAKTNMPFPVGTRVRCTTDAEYLGMEGEVVGTSIFGMKRCVRFDVQMPDLVFDVCELEEVS